MKGKELRKFLEDGGVENEKVFNKKGRASTRFYVEAIPEEGKESGGWIWNIVKQKFSISFPDRLTDEQKLANQKARDEKRQVYWNEVKKENNALRAKKNKLRAEIKALGQARQIPVRYR